MELQKVIRGIVRFFRVLARDCGALRHAGREFNINNVTPDGYLVQDIYRRRPPVHIPRNDSNLQEVQLYPEFVDNS